MLYNALLSLTAFVFCLSLFLVHRARVLENDFRKLQGDIILQLNQPCSERVDGKLAKMSKTSEDIEPRVFQKAQSSLKISSRRVKREPSSHRAPTAFLQLRADTNKQPDIRGNITVISWTVSAQQGNAISQKENRIVVQEGGYYLVFGQVLFESPSIVMGHVIRSRSSAKAGARSTELLRCLQAMPDTYPANTCYIAATQFIPCLNGATMSRIGVGLTEKHQRHHSECRYVVLLEPNKTIFRQAGGALSYRRPSFRTVQLLQDDELELVIPDRPTALISMDEDSTFFGVIQLN